MDCTKRYNSGTTFCRRWRRRRWEWYQFKICISKCRRWWRRKWILHFSTRVDLANTSFLTILVGQGGKGGADPGMSTVGNNGQDGVHQLSSNETMGSLLQSVIQDLLEVLGPLKFQGMEEEVMQAEVVPDKNHQVLCRVSVEQEYFLGKTATPQMALAPDSEETAAFSLLWADLEVIIQALQVMRWRRWGSYGERVSNGAPALSLPSSFFNGAAGSGGGGGGTLDSVAFLTSQIPGGQGGDGQVIIMY